MNENCIYAGKIRESRKTDGMRILYVTTIAMTMNFFKSLAGELFECGHTLDIACNTSDGAVDPFFSELGCRVYSVDCSRSPLNSGNIRAISQIRRIVKEGHYDVVHCHTPIAAACTRFACRKLRRSGKPRVFYTAHGFHFFKGAPKKNWMVYYPIEKICSYMTDVLITINSEDFELAGKNFNAGRTCFIPGVGIDTERFASAEQGRFDDICHPAIFSVGELNDNKNHEAVIRALKEIPNAHYYIAGEGSLREHLLAVADTLELSERVHLLGYRNDVGSLYKNMDILVHPSFREGLPVSVMEAMAAGLPIVGSDIRGMRDLLENDCRVLFNPLDQGEIAQKISAVLNESALRTELTKKNLDVIGKYDSRVLNQMYVDLLEDCISNRLP